MSKSLLLMFCILTGLLVIACAKSADTNRNLTAANSSSPAPAGTPVAPPTNRNGNGNENASAGAIGIAECDTFITAYENCVSTKVPEQARAALKTSVTTWRAEWKKLADNPQTRGTLAAACKRQAEAARTSMKPYGCTF